MTQFDDDAAARHYEDPANLAPAGPAYPTRGPRGSKGLSSHVPVRFGPDLVAAVKRLADIDGVTVSSWVRALVAREVERRQPRPTTVHSPVERLEFRGATAVTQTISDTRPSGLQLTGT
jgi:hypothetical protein